MMKTNSSLFAALAKSPFRSRFHLKGRERNIVEEKGIATIRQHAYDISRKRLAPADPLHDGKQTPFRGHPVFIAQHATATCCRTCLSKWHKIPKGSELTDEEINYVVATIMQWITHDMA